MTTPKRTLEETVAEEAGRLRVWIDDRLDIALEASAYEPLATRIADTLATIAEAARQEEREALREIVLLVRDGFRTAREDPQTARWICDEILTRSRGEAFSGEPGTSSAAGGSWGYRAKEPK